MRKTVDEWLMSHQKGAGMPKKRRHKEPAELPPLKVKNVSPTKKKAARKKSKRKPR